MPVPTKTPKRATIDTLVAVLQTQLNAHADIGVDGEGDPWVPVIKGWRTRSETSDQYAPSRMGYVSVWLTNPDPTRIRKTPLRDGTGAGGDPVDADERVNLVGSWRATWQVDITTYRVDMLQPLVEVLRPMLCSKAGDALPIVAMADCSTLVLRLADYAWTRVRLVQESEGPVEEEGADAEGELRYRFAGAVRGDLVEVETGLYQINTFDVEVEGGPEVEISS